MATIFDHLFGSGAQPVQRKGNFRITYDQLGTPTVVAVDAEGHAVTKEGSTDSAGLVFDTFYSCGHPLTFPLGGQCVECLALSCLQCFWTCLACHCPLCKKHGIVVESKQGGKATYCASCYDVLKRRQFIKLLLSPLVRFDDSQSPPTKEKR